MSEAYRRTHIENQLRTLLDTTSSSTAYDILDNTFSEPEGITEEKLTVWRYRAERARRQMVASALGEKAAAITVARLSAHLDTYDDVVIASCEPHQVRSASLQDFVTTMNHWFSDILTEVVQQGDSVTEALIEAGTERYPYYRKALIDWLEHQRSKGKDVTTWTEPPLHQDAGQDLIYVYRRNMANELLNQFLIFGLESSGSELPASDTLPDEHAHTRLHQIPKFTSSTNEVSQPVLGPFWTYDPDNKFLEKQQDKSTPQTLYSAWEKDPTPHNARTFLTLSQTEPVKNNLEKLNSFPGMGEDGRALNAGHCHVDIRIINEEAFPVAPRSLLVKLGENALAQTSYLNIATIVSAVGFNAATHTFYKHWPKHPV